MINASFKKHLRLLGLDGEKTIRKKGEMPSSLKIFSRFWVLSPIFGAATTIDLLVEDVHWLTNKKHMEE